MLAQVVAWLAQLPADRKLLLLLCVYGASAAPLLFWIMWRVLTRPAPKVCPGCAVCAACFAAARACTLCGRTAPLLVLHVCRCAAAGVQQVLGLSSAVTTDCSIYVLIRLFTTLPCVQGAGRGTLVAAGCSTPVASAQSKGFSSTDAAALAKVISGRRSVFPRDFSTAPLDRCLPYHTRMPACSAVQVC